MSKEESIKSEIENSRKVSDDGSLVTYDLTNNLDFTNPKAVAKAISEVFFEKDALNWFKVKDEKIEFEPTYRVRLILAEDHSKKLENVVDDFMKDLQKDEISKDFSKEISSGVNNEKNFQSAIATSALKSTLFHHSIDKVYGNEIKDDLFLDLLEKIEIRSLNNEDLINWKKLPL